MFRILLITLLLATSGLATAMPKITLIEATRLAEAYVMKQKIPNSERYLASVSWHEDLKNPEKSYWSILWLPNNGLIDDAQLVVQVYDNGKITHQDSWA